MESMDFQVSPTSISRFHSNSYSGIDSNFLTSFSHRQNVKTVGDEIPLHTYFRPPTAYGVTVILCVIFSSYTVSFPLLPEFSPRYLSSPLSSIYLYPSLLYASLRQFSQTLNPVLPAGFICFVSFCSVFSHLLTF